jgi:hypothetical protein
MIACWICVFMVWFGWLMLCYSTWFRLTARESVAVQLCAAGMNNTEDLPDPRSATCIPNSDGGARLAPEDAPAGHHLPRFERRETSWENQNLPAACGRLLGRLVSFGYNGFYASLNRCALNPILEPPLSQLRNGISTQLSHSVPVQLQIMAEKQPDALPRMRPLLPGRGAARFGPAALVGL